MTITPEAVHALRLVTGMGLMECKKILEGEALEGDLLNYDIDFENGGEATNDVKIKNLRDVLLTIVRDTYPKRPS